jgi:hypothetical protein
MMVQLVSRASWLERIATLAPALVEDVGTDELERIADYAWPAQRAWWYLLVHFLENARTKRSFFFSPRSVLLCGHCVTELIVLYIAEVVQSAGQMRLCTRQPHVRRALASLSCCPSCATRSISTGVRYSDSGVA